MNRVVPVIVGHASAFVALDALRCEGKRDTWRVTTESVKTEFLGLFKFFSKNNIGVENKE